MYLKASKVTLTVPQEVSDEKLMARYRRGDFEAMDELVRRYEKPLFSFLWRMSGNGADVQEIFQEVWLRVIAKARDFKQKRFKGWIFTIARNLVIDTSRRQKRL
ncbi:MAG: sigma-70 family RNA polymerase sigma factor, partial [bacterium]